MKSVKMIGMTLGISLAAALGNAPTAYAAVNNHPGSICQPDIPSDSVNVNYDNSKITNNGSSPVSVICPIIRTSTTSTGATVYVDVEHYFNTTTSCSVSSFDFNGTFLGSAVGSFNGVGFKEIAMSLGSGKSSFWSRYTVKCTIPGNKIGSILGIILSD
ncbi:MAG: hypothetical protein JNJ76_10310 [Candidatus Competibacter sp.]|nr:hypothetical protein [Candidatus Competibacter sp.]